MKKNVFWLILLSLGSLSVRAEPVAKPNIVFVLLDDLDAVASAPFFEEAMPFTSRLVATQGINFRAAHSAAICCEARAAILTGLLQHNNGVFTNGGTYGGRAAFVSPRNGAGAPLLDDRGQPINNEERTVARYLREAGYETMILGKYLNGYETQDGRLPEVLPHWDRGAVFVSPGAGSYVGYNYELLTWSRNSQEAVKLGRAESDYSTDVLTAKALDYLQESSRQITKPFFMYMAYTAPHLPLPPAKRHKETALRWRGTLPKDPEVFFSDGDEFADKPQWLQRTIPERDTKQLRRWAERDWQLRLGSLLAVDEGIAALWQTLEATGQAKNTIVIVTSDNGYNNGAHALIHKMAPYEDSIRVPLWVIGGLETGLSRGVARDEWIGHVDHVPTLLALAGAKTPAQLDGKNYATLLRSMNTSAADVFRSTVFFSYLGGMAANGHELPHGIATEITPEQGRIRGFLLDIPTHLGVKTLVRSNGDTKTVKLIFWPASDRALFTQGEAWEGGEWELYNLTDDPKETRNLLHYRGEECRKLTLALQRELAVRFQCRGTACSANGGPINANFDACLSN